MSSVGRMTGAKLEEIGDDGIDLDGVLFVKLIEPPIPLRLSTGS